MFFDTDESIRRGIEDMGDLGIEPNRKRSERKKQLSTILKDLAPALEALCQTADDEATKNLHAELPMDMLLPASILLAPSEKGFKLRAQIASTQIIPTSQLKEDLADTLRGFRDFIKKRDRMQDEMKRMQEGFTVKEQEIQEQMEILDHQLWELIPENRETDVPIELNKRKGVYSLTIDEEETFPDLDEKRAGDLFTKQQELEQQIEQLDQFEQVVQKCQKWLQQNAGTQDAFEKRTIRLLDKYFSNPDVILYDFGLSLRSDQEPFVAVLRVKEEDFETPDQLARRLSELLKKNLNETLAELSA